jgi:endonuclease III
LTKQIEVFERDPPKKQIRNDWTKWSVVDPTNYDFMNSDLKEYCMDQMKAIPSKYHQQLILLHRLIPMLASQEVMDERLYEYYLAIIQGRFTIQQWLLPLKKQSAFDYYKVLADTTRTYSMQHKKAERLLLCMAIAACMFNSLIPTNHQHLEAFPEMGPKKTAVVLNSVGYYRNVNLGVDTHVRDCFSYFIKKYDLNEDQKILTQLASRIPMSIGFKTK